MTADLNKGDTRLIIRTCEKYGLLRNQTAYVLATALWETAHTMEPVREALADSDESSIARLERAWKSGKLPWVSKPYWRDGFFGRGYVQLTHETNYVRAGNELGVDLAGNPSRALEADIAAEILVRGMRDGWFTGKRLGDYVTLKASNYRGARRIVNGTDKAAAIAALAEEYEDALLASGYGVEKAVPVANERKDGTPPRETKLKSRTLWSQVQQWLTTGGVGAFAFFQSQDDMTKIIIGAVVVVSMICGAIIWRDRIRKWDWGVR